jgi:hypothetical protein
MNVPLELERNTCIAATTRHLACGLADESVILNLDNGIYYGLDTVGSHVWELLKGGITYGGLLDAVLARYDASEATVDRDLRVLLAQMHEQGLVHIGTHD